MFFMGLNVPNAFLNDFKLMLNIIQIGFETA